ncbi:hypothetical protein HT031_001945 [Scenedesmus sp. PABB004]|nr:hypothetical protein HT031_001945 [Scenedesmus sp. PABB004]
MLRRAAPAARCPARVRARVMHKLDLGFARAARTASAPDHAPPAGGGLRRAGSGARLPSPARPRSPVTCAVGGTLLRALPPSSGAPVDPTDAAARCQWAGDAVVGDADAVPRHLALDRYDDNDTASAAAPGAPPSECAPAPPARGQGGPGLPGALAAHIPGGPLAEDGAMCEPAPGDPPGELRDADIAALRGGAPPPAVDQERAPRGGEQAAAGGAGEQGAGGPRSASQPAGDPEAVKRAVREETAGPRTEAGGEP